MFYGSILKTEHSDIGFPPDALKFRGEQKVTYTQLNMMDYGPDHLTESEITSIDEVLPYLNSKETSWFNVDGVHNEETMLAISKLLNLDTVILSDVMNPHARPKIQEYDNCLYISVKMLKYDDELKEVKSENLVLIVLEHLLISFQEYPGDVFDPVRERIRKNRKRIRTSGPDYLAFALLDVIISNYMYIISKIGHKIEGIEDQLLKDLGVDTLEMMKHYKGELNYVKKSVKPCQEVIHYLGRGDSDFLGDYINIHVNELHSDINLTCDTIDSYRETLSDQLNFYHSSVSSKLNDVMKFLTIFSVIFTPITFIVGVYGTNFDNLPEIHTKYGYFVMWGIMIIIVISMLTYFKRKKWF